MQLTPEQKNDFCRQIANEFKAHNFFELAKKYEFAVKNGLLANTFSLIILTGFAKELLDVIKLSGTHNTDYLEILTRIEEIAAVFVEQDKDSKYQEQMMLQRQILAELRKLGTRLDTVERKLNSSQSNDEPTKISSPHLFKN